MQTTQKQQQIDSRGRGFFRGLMLCFIFCLYSNLLNANQLGFIEYMKQEQLALKTKIEQQQNFKPGVKFAEINQQLKENRLKISLIDLKIQSFNEFLESQHKEQLLTEHKLRILKKNYTLAQKSELYRQRIDKLEQQKQVEVETISIIADNIKSAQQLKALYLQQSKILSQWINEHRLKLKLANVTQQQIVLDKNLSQLYQQNINIQQAIQTHQKGDELQQDELKLLLNNQQISLTQQQKALLLLKGDIVRADDRILKQQDMKSLRSVLGTYKDVIQHIDKIQVNLENMLEVLNQQDLFKNNPNLSRTKQAVSTELKQLTQWQQQLHKQLENWQEQLNIKLSSRQTFTEYQQDGFGNILQQIASIPSKFLTYANRLVLKVMTSYHWFSPLQLWTFWGSMAIILLLAFLIKKGLGVLDREKERYRLTGYLVDGFIDILNRNLWQITSIFLLLNAFSFMGVSAGQSSLLVNLLMVWMTFRILITFAKRSLLERISDASGKDVKLYYRLKWLLVSGGWATALMLIGHQLPLSPVIQDIFNRLFMLFILAISIVSWRSRDLLPHIFHSLYKGKKRYYRNAFKLFIILLPVTLLTTAVVGLAGYINLAWSMSRYQAVIVLIIISYTVIRGLLVDILEVLSEWLISSTRNGWLWTEVFLKPVYKVLRFLLLILSLFLMLQSIGGWSSDSMFINFIDKLIRYPFIDISGVRITLLSSFEFTILLMVFTWAAKWTREFCYRWLFRNVKDAGIRNSLAAFSQYAVILLGTFLTLRVLGLDFSGMSFVLGGLAVGMGFGLRDFASNIIGGLMLLIERPVREGDLITLGSYEGRVAHIGIRSMRVSSWDNMEVLIPNAETFNKPFTNWTHQDYIVRTVIPLKVSRKDDPHFVQQLILDVLAIIPDILPDPPAQVFMKSMEEALIEFEVRYFINIEKHSRFEIRSKVLFAISAQFKAAGIKAPVPPYQVEITGKNAEIELDDAKPEK